MARDFIWKGKKTKIALEILQASKDEGGLGICNLMSKNKAMKMQWICRIQEDKKLAELAYKALDLPIKDLVWKLQLCKEDVPTVIEKQSFWREVLSCWCKIAFDTAYSKEQVQNK